MNTDLQNLLARRADSVESPVFDPRVVMAGAQRRLRRRNRFVAAGAALTLAVTLGVTALVLDRRGDPTVPSDRLDRGLTWTPGTRPITYGQEQTLHLGDREIATGIDFLSVDVTDDGAALTTLDGGIWFTDGTTVERIGSTIPLRVTAHSVSGPVGRPRRLGGHRRGRFVARLAGVPGPASRPSRAGGLRLEQSLCPQPGSDRRARLQLRGDDPRPRGSGGLPGRGLERLPGSRLPASVSMWTPACSNPSTRPTSRLPAAAVSRALVVGPSADDGRLLHWEGDGPGLNSVE